MIKIHTLDKDTTLDKDRQTMIKMHTLDKGRQTR